MLISHIALQCELFLSGMATAPQSRHYWPLSSQSVPRRRSDQLETLNQRIDDLAGLAGSSQEENASQPNDDAPEGRTLEEEPAAEMANSEAAPAAERTDAIAAPEQPAGPTVISLKDLSAFMQQTERARQSAINQKALQLIGRA